MDHMWSHMQGSSRSWTTQFWCTWRPSHCPPILSPVYNHPLWESVCKHLSLSSKYPHMPNHYNDILHSTQSNLSNSNAEDAIISMNTRIYTQIGNFLDGLNQARGVSSMMICLESFKMLLKSQIDISRLPWLKWVHFITSWIYNELGSQCLHKA